MLITFENTAEKRRRHAKKISGNAGAARQRAAPATRQHHAGARSHAPVLNPPTPRMPRGRYSTTSGSIVAALARISPASAR